MLWFWAIYLCANDKRGISAAYLANLLDIGYESAWYMLVRIRKAMGQPVLLLLFIERYLDRGERKGGCFHQKSNLRLGGNLCINKRFIPFLTKWGFLPKPSRAGMPSRTNLS